MIYLSSLSFIYIVPADDLVIAKTPADSVLEMQSGATASGPGSKHPEQEQLFDVFEVRE